jgi:hypothetical protein
VENLCLAAVSCSTDTETYFFQLAGEQKQLHTTHQVVLAMAQETYMHNPNLAHLSAFQDHLTNGERALELKAAVDKHWVCYCGPPQ